MLRAILRAHRTGKKEEQNDRERNALKGHCAELDLDFKLGESSAKYIWSLKIIGVLSNCTCLVPPKVEWMIADCTKFGPWLTGLNISKGLKIKMFCLL